ncbi:peptidoglycan-binding domain-containing protein [Streptomyces sp. NBC_00239]|uniref:peptidoglycan-binding domain-containing protein n=1 Tax=Streptomyces sp. NBC_00239 TaxID=2903640 RepID=UPI002E2E1693|nr:peptidoglycan-binding domain-containing protein [Streptomyces sp. NBC_00239]
MALLSSARFRDDPVLERIAARDTSAYLRQGHQGEHVTTIQFALIDLGYEIPDGATGYFGGQTADAVKLFQESHELDHDAIVGADTLAVLDDAWALPFADRNEWLSWQERPIPEFNFTRKNELDRQTLGSLYAFNPLGAPLPLEFQDGLLLGLEWLLNPRGSPDGMFTPPASWGAGPLDTYHCHVVLAKNPTPDPAWGAVRSLAAGVRNRARLMQLVANTSAPIGTPAWTEAYRELLLDPTSAGTTLFAEAYADVLKEVLLVGRATGQFAWLLWHTFEEPRWRPPGLTSDSPQRSWWNAIAPYPTDLTRTPFSATEDDVIANTVPLIDLQFFIDRQQLITVLGPSYAEPGAIVHLETNRIDAAAKGLPYP